MPCLQGLKYQGELGHGSEKFFLGIAFQSYPVASTLVLKPHCSCFEPVVKHYCWSTPAAAEQVAADENTVLDGPFLSADGVASAAAWPQASSEVRVLGEVLEFVVPSASARLDDEVAVGVAAGAFHPFHKEQCVYSNHDAKNYALNHDDVEIYLWNGYDFYVAYIPN